MILTAVILPTDIPDSITNNKIEQCPKMGSDKLAAKQNIFIIHYKEVTMIDFLFLALPNDLAYQDLKKEVKFEPKLQPYSCWAFKCPLTIFSHDLKQKHTFHDGRVEVQNIEQPVLEQKWKYFVITRADGTRLYCTSYVFYEKREIREERNLFFSLNGPLSTLSEFYVPKCLILKSQKPYFKLQTNLIKIHRELRRDNNWILQKINRESLQAFEIELKGQNQNENMRKKLRTSLISIDKRNLSREVDPFPAVSIETSFNYYITAANQQLMRQKIYICPQNKLQILHVYNISESLYRINYFFHLPISMDNVMVILAAILQERQIIFTSTNQNSNLMLMETLLQMLAPLKWEYMYVPNLPESMLDAAEYSFIPYMVGIHRKYLDKITTCGRVVVHVDTDTIEMDEPLLELPIALRNMFNIVFANVDNDQSYLKWQKQMRMKSILMVSTLLAQFPLVQQNCTQSPDFPFYWFFFEKSAMYNTFKEQMFRQQNIEISELFWVPMEMKLQIIQSKFRNVLNSASFPSICQNDKEWIKYYYNIEKSRKSLKNGRQSLNNARFNMNSQALLRSTTITSSTTSIDGKQEVKNRNKVHALTKKGIGFVHSTVKL